MKSRIFITLQDKKLLFRINDEKNTNEYTFKNTKDYPNVPFYISIFEDIDVFKEAKPFIKSKISPLKKMLIKPTLYVFINDDVIGFEKTAIEDFIMTLFSGRSVYLANQCAFVSPKGNNTYVSISKSSRMIMLTYIKDRYIKAQEFLRIKDYSVDEIKNLISNLHSDLRYNKLDVFINGDSLKKYSELGTMVDIYNILDNGQNILSSLDMKKYL